METLLPLNDMCHTVRSEDVRFDDARTVNKDCPTSVGGDEELRVSNCKKTCASGQGGRVQHWSMKKVVRCDLRRCNRCLVEG